MQDLPQGSGNATIKGQEVIRTRAFDSVSQMWNSYVPRRSASFNLTPAQRYASICNILLNTKVPTILSTFGHSILAYDFYSSGATQGVLLVNDPNYPGTVQTIRYDPAFSNRFWYVSPDETWTNLAVMGDGSFQLESFWSIYVDAVNGFNGNGAAQVNVTSHTDGQEVTSRTITLSGTVDSGQVLIDKLRINLNGATTIETPVNTTTGAFSVQLSLNAGTNTLSFITIGPNGQGQHWITLNSQKQPFKIIANLNQAAILVTLTWDTDSSDLDLYTIDPTGDYSAYFHHTTADGGNLDFDNTYGYGPEHWTLTYANTVRWGSNYTVRVHYYSDHLSCQSCDPVVPVRPTGWTVTVLLYEGTPQMTTATFSGVLGDAIPSNHYPADSGPDWADVVTITPVQPGPSRQVSMTKTESGKIQIIVPVPSDEECLQLKLAPQSRQ